jgi:prolyl-tRNA synthetase
MKDSYTLDTTWEGLDAAYEAHAEAYRKIFTRSGIRFFEVGASSGAMGGTGSQEFMVEAEHGEDSVVRCSTCTYAANLEIATSAVAPHGQSGPSKPLVDIHTPNVKTIKELVEFLKVEPTRLAKSLAYLHNDKPVLILISGDDQLNEAKLSAALGGGAISAIEGERLMQLTGADAGSIGPVMLKGFRIIADKRLEGANNLISGANRNDYHIGNIDLKRDASVEAYYDLREAKPGEPCPKCGSPLKISNTIELGHIFKLGTKYSDALGATFLDENGTMKPIIMGSYGIGIERIIACHIEQSHDDKGIIWNTALAPYLVHIIAVSMSSLQTAQASEQIYESLTRAGVDCLLDERPNLTAGYKFNDADLIGMPLQIVVGDKGLKNNQVEFKERRTGERSQVKLQDVVAEVKKFLAAH